MKCRQQSNEENILHYTNLMEKKFSCPPAEVTNRKKDKYALCPSMSTVQHPQGCRNYSPLWLLHVMKVTVVKRTGRATVFPTLTILYRLFSYLMFFLKAMGPGIL